MASQGTLVPEEQKQNRQEILRDLVMSAEWVDPTDTVTPPEEQVAQKYQRFLTLSPKEQEGWEETLSSEERAIIGKNPYLVIRQVLIDMGVETFTYAVLQKTTQEPSSPLLHSFSLPKSVYTPQEKEEPSPSFGSPLDRDQQEFPRPEALHTRAQRIASRIANEEIPNALLLSSQDNAVPFPEEELARNRVREALPMPTPIRRRQSVEMEAVDAPSQNGEDIPERRQSLDGDVQSHRQHGKQRITQSTLPQKKKGTLTGTLVKGGAIVTVIGGTATVGSAFLLDLLGFHT